MIKQRSFFILWSLIGTFLIVGSGYTKDTVTHMKLSSPAFFSNGSIPSRFTCQGADISPRLDIAAIPPRTESLALIVDDPDAPMGTWVHWVVFNIPVVNVIEEGSVPGVEGINDFGRLHYGGPCPPSGTHRYFFKLYALDTRLDISPGIDKEGLEDAMRGHILAESQLIGLYSKQ